MKEETTRVWFCSPDDAIAQVIARALGPGYDVRRSEEFDLKSARGQEGWWDVVLLDLRATDNDHGLDAGLHLIDEFNQFYLPPPVVVMVAEDDPALTIQLVEKGAFEIIAGPPNMVELRLIIRRAHRLRQTEKELYQLRSQERSAGRLHDLLGSSQCMEQVFALARKIAPCDVSLLIMGETGTGKELLARAIHHLSSRAAGPFVAFSCANLPETLVEDELFGHEKGAFTGAIMSRRGRFEAADQGTLFLDEVGDLPLALQAKLLRVLQEHSFERLGSNTPITVNIRLVCATHQNLAEMVEQGKFREDLYYRLNVMQIHLPPLRERRGEIPFLARHFLQRFSQQFGKKSKRFSRSALHALEEYNWPGNVRELENVVQRAVVMADGATIELWHLPKTLRNGFAPPPLARSYDQEVDGFRRRLIVRTLHACGWRKAEAARTLGISRGYLHRLISQLGIQPEEAESADDLFGEPPPPSRLM